MGKKLAAGDLDDIDVDSLLQDAAQTPTGIEHAPMGETFLKAFGGKGKGGEKGMRGEAAKRLLKGSSQDPAADSLTEKINSGQLPSMED
jgi:hypothetical protein